MTEILLKGPSVVIHPSVLKITIILFNNPPELQIRGGIEDNSKIIFLISQQKHIL